MATELDDSQRTGYRAGVRLRSIPRALAAGTAVGCLALGAGGFVLGRSMAPEGNPPTAPVQAAEPEDQADPIVIPERLEVPRG